METDHQMEEVNKPTHQHNEHHTNGTSHETPTPAPLKPTTSSSPLSPSSPSPSTPQETQTTQTTTQQSDTSHPPNNNALNGEHGSITNTTNTSASPQTTPSPLPFNFNPVDFSNLNLLPDNLANFTTTTSSTSSPAPPATTDPSSTTLTPATTDSKPTAAANSGPPISFEEFLLSFGGQNLSDEEFAVKLQQYYEMTDAQAAATASAAAAAAQGASSTMDEDEKLAKKLQEQFYSEITKENKPQPSTNYNYYNNKSYNSYSAPPPSPPASTSHAPPVLLTPQTASTVLKNIGTTTSTTTSTTTAAESDEADKPEEQPKAATKEPEKEKHEDEEVVCLVCHDSEFEEYVILPACEHRYCIDCASHMMSNPPSNQMGNPFGGRRPKKAVQGDAGSIQCAMCESVTDLDPVAGLDGLKRRVKKRKAADAFSSDCSIHSQPLLFYCFDHREPVCFACIQLGGPHNGHKYDALDSAVAKLKQETANKLLNVNQKRHKIEEFKAGVESHKVQIVASGEKKFTELKEYLVKVRKLLDKKEKDLELEIKRMVDRKSLIAQQETKWADEKLALLDKTIAGVGSLLDENSKKDSQPDACLRFVAGLADCEDQLADAVVLPAKQVNNDQYNFPPLTTAFSLTQRAINNLSYNDSLQAPGLSSYDDGDYSDDDGVEGEEEY